MKAFKTVLKVLGIILLALIVIVAGYLTYVLIDYHRLPDAAPLTITGGSGEAAPVNEPLSITTFNIGFGAYSSDYSFFMDGGDESWARSEQAVYDNTAGCIGFVSDKAPDFAFFQEVDIDSTRSYHVDQRELLDTAFPEMSSVWACNYDSPFLMYPIFQPHGKSVAGLATLSAYGMTSAIRRSLPIDTGLSKFIDLDRCYSVVRVATEDGRELCLYNVHLTAYATDETIVPAQIDMLFSDMAAEYGRGNYVICGGDFNRDLWGDSAHIFDVADDPSEWNLPFMTDKLPQGFSLAEPDSRTTPTCRSAETPYAEGKTFVTVLDGFFVSDNVAVETVENIDAGFAYSDHNPVYMQFMLS